MTTSALCLFAQLKSWDADFYNNLASLDSTADQLAGEKTGDGCLTSQNWQTLFAQQRITQSDQCNIFATFTLYETRLRLGQQRDKLIAWFGTNPKLNVGGIIGRLNQLLDEKKISKEEIPWITFTYIKTFLQYKQSDPNRSPEVVFSWGIYDCSEQTEIMQTICNHFGIENKAVVFWTGPDGGHTFLAYKISGKWGYASVMRFTEPQSESLYDICKAWEWKRHRGVYHFGYHHQGKFTPQGYYEI